MFHKITLVAASPVMRSPKRTHRFARMAEAVVLFLLCLFSPDDKAPHSEWFPTPFHQCKKCLGQLHFDGEYWSCRGCGSRYAFQDITEKKTPHTVSGKQFHRFALTEYFREFQAGRIELRDGKPYLAGEKDLRVNTAQLPTIKRGSV